MFPVEVAHKMLGPFGGGQGIARRLMISEGYGLNGGKTFGKAA